MAFNVKDEIMKAINGTNDPSMRTVFMIMLGLFESFNDKLDEVLGDEKAMRAAVLNGHEPVHHTHHEWLEKRIKRDPEIELLLAWVITAKKRDEENAQSGRKIRDGLTEKVIWAALAGSVMFILGRGGV